jgi:hypothetical protein
MEVFDGEAALPIIQNGTVRAITDIAVRICTSATVATNSSSRCRMLVFLPGGFEAAAAAGGLLFSMDLDSSSMLLSSSITTLVVSAGPTAWKEDNPINLIVQVI